ncbi:MAG: hypothetical protein JSS78_11320 [Bacteroidetes bacterium]|nr:hypothetical protein [Bacteroidota bacterium]
MRNKMTSEANISVFNFRNQLNYFKAIIIVLFTGFFSPVFAQNSDTIKLTPPPSPIIISSVIGNNGVHLQTIFSKSFNPTSRFGVFGIVDLYGVYSPSEQPMRNQQMAQTQLTYRIVKGLNVSAGAFF